MPKNARAEGTTGSFTRMSEALLNFDLRQAAELYLNFIESVTTQILDFQERSLNWAKETPLEPIVEFNTSIARKLAETSISAARNLCRIETPSY